MICGFSDNLQKQKDWGTEMAPALLQPGVQGGGPCKPWVWQCSGWFLSATTYHRLLWRHSDCEVRESLSDSWKAAPWLAFSSSRKGKISRWSPRASGLLPHLPPSSTSLSKCSAHSRNWANTAKCLKEWMTFSNGLPNRTREVFIFFFTFN